MAGKRKRKRHCGSAEDSPRKRLQAAGSYEESRSTGLAGSPIIKHPVLSLYYPRVVTLRQYLLHQLPASSKARRRRLVAVGSCPEETRSGSTPCGSAEGLRETRANGADQPLLCVEDRDRALACLLDLSLVCGPEMVHWNQDQSRVNDLATFSQQQLRSTGGSSFRGNSCSQSEVRGGVLTSVVVAMACRVTRDGDFPAIQAIQILPAMNY
ncbi:hypothetical protein MMC16_003381 [Acarospora aff. strigata]|nr:hypothetical protein [Acarospora aff. strigata]